MHVTIYHEPSMVMRPCGVRIQITKVSIRMMQKVLTVDFIQNGLF